MWLSDVSRRMRKAGQVKTITTYQEKDKVHIWNRPGLSGITGNLKGQHEAQDKERILRKLNTLLDSYLEMGNLQWTEDLNHDILTIKKAIQDVTFERGV